jgi:hypothetical protein
MNAGSKGGKTPGRQGVVVPHEPKRSQRIAAWSVFLLERLVTFSLRCDWRDYSGLADAQDGRL